MLKHVYLKEPSDPNWPTIQKEGYPVYATDESGREDLVAVTTKEHQRMVALAIAAWHNVPFSEPASPDQDPNSLRRPADETL